MRKLISLLLALTMVFSMAIAVSAEGEVASSEAKTFEFKKTYTTTAGSTPATVPAEVLEFEIDADDNNPDETMISIADQTISGTPQNIKINVPSYSVAGKYNYTITEVEGNTQGVDYDTTSVIAVQVLVTFNDDHTALESQVVITTGYEKDDTIENKYDLGNLSVKKLVDGNLADETDEFDITIKFTATKDVLSDITISGIESGTIASTDWDNGTWEETYTFSHDNTITFTNIPAGITWEVVEDTKYTTGDKNTKNYGYEDADYDGNEEGTVVADQDITTVITNVKDTEVDTGVITDSAPYILLIAVCAVAAVLFVTKRRSVEF